MHGLIAIILVLLIQRSQIDLAIQYFVLRRMRRRRLRLRFLHSLQLLYLFHRARRMLVGRQPRRAWVFPRPQNWFQQLLNNRPSTRFLLLADLISNSPARDDVGFGINIRCKYPNLAHPLVSSCCRKEERLFLNVCPTGGNRKEHSKAKTKNTHREPRKFAMLVTETSKRDAASAPISPKKKCAQACAPDYAVSCY